MRSSGSASPGGWGFAAWVSDAPTGGNVYDRRLITELQALGVDLREHRVAGVWPRASTTDRRALDDLLTREERWLVDAIVACGAPGAITALVAAGRPVVVLVHSFMSDEDWGSADDLRRYVDAERTVLRAATRVVCTSRWSADEVARRYARTDAAVARPGVDPAPPAPGSRADGPARLLSLGTVNARKGQLVLVRALAALTELPWTAQVVGAVDVEPAYVAAVRAEVQRLDLVDRIEVTGPRTGAALDAVWRATDLHVLTSRAETYGMVVVEALARGVPSVVVAGTGAEEAQLAGGTAEQPGLAVPSGDPATLAAALRRWLTDDGVRQRWRAAAMDGRDRLPRWDTTARSVAAALQRSSAIER